MNKYKITTGILTGLLTIFLVGCSSQDDLGADNQAINDASTSVRFKLNTGASTNNHRAQATNMGTKAALDREKTISSAYAVVFKDDYHHNTYELTDAIKDASDYYVINLRKLGRFDIYVIANPDDSWKADLNDDTKIQTVADFKKLVVTQEPGANNLATNFLMTPALGTPVTAQLVGKTIEPDDLGTIHLIRAASRIDINASEIPNLSITEVKFRRRYTSTQLININMGDDTSSVTDASGSKVIAPATDKQYIWDEVTTGDDIVKHQDNQAWEDDSGTMTTITDITNQMWRGVLYGFQNDFDLPADHRYFTVVNITGTWEGSKFSYDVAFADASGNGIRLCRNTLYEIVLHEIDEFGNLKYNIEVKDWDEADVLQYTDVNLDTNEMPSIVKIDGADNATDNPSVDVAYNTTSLTIQVKMKKADAKILYETDPAPDGVGVKETSMTIDDDNYHIQNFLITLPQNDTTDDIVYKFVIENSVNKEKKQTLTITHQKQS